MLEGAFCAGAFAVQMTALESMLLVSEHQALQAATAASKGAPVSHTHMQPRQAWVSPTPPDGELLSHLFLRVTASRGASERVHMAPTVRQVLSPP